jgi:hypothetical protein
MQPEGLTAKDAVAQYNKELNDLYKYDYTSLVKNKEKYINYIYRLMQKTN